MNRIYIDKKTLPKELLAGVEAIQQEFPARFSDRGIPVRFSPEDDGGKSWALSGEDAPVVSYDRPIDAFRALGRLFGTERLPADESERCAFSMLGTMVDVSRNGVLRLDAAQSLICRLALMGLNTVFLYTEDVYEVEGEPFWGYLRGAYTAEELRTLDRFASGLGIEMIPCIQTLAHLEQVLQWPAYWDIRDTERVLMADEDRTYALISKLLATVSSCFRTKRIHLGMDEAHGIGKGNYLKKHGEKTPFAILQDHLKRVGDLCREHGLEPMIWSDMYFRLGSKEHEYYDPEAVIPEWVRDTIPGDFQLVYWDYYHLEKDFYRDWIDRHRALGKEPVLAPGAWTWNRLWAALPFAFGTIDAAMGVAREKGLREAFVTAWGDDGAECDPFSMLPALQRFAEHGYQSEVNEHRLARNFAGACGANWADWIRASDIDAPNGRGEQPDYSNLGKLLLWQDPLLAIYDPLVDPERFPRHFGQLAEELEVASEKNNEAGHLRLPSKLARVLEIKATLRIELADAYTSGDTGRLRRLTEERVPELRQRVDALWREHRSRWMTTYKPFGWEVVEARYGRLRTRLETLQDRLTDYLENRLATLPELEAKLHRVDTESGFPFDHSRNARASTPSWLK